MVWRHPDPASLPSLAAERTRVWEHTVTDSEFLQVRYGVCSRPLSLDLVAPDFAADGVDPAAAAALRRLLAVQRVQPTLPATVDLRAFDRIEICGTAEEARSLARAMVCSAAAFQSPGLLAIAVLASEDTLAEWDWVKWLPHARSPRRSDAVGPRRMVATDFSELASLLPADTHVLLVVDGGTLPPRRLPRRDGHDGVTVLALPDRWGEDDDHTRLRLLLDDRAGRADAHVSMCVQGSHEPQVRAVADQCDLATAEALARRLAPLADVAGGEIEPTRAGGTIDAMGLWGLPDVRRYDPATGWRSRPARHRLRVPIGVADGAEPVHLDLKEAAQQGMGPHGLVIGATGSGKSELLRTLVLGLALTHSPEELNLVLVDFKGGATFAGMSAMPHVSALITNLADELTLVDRMQDALSGELVRRQEVLRAAGNHASVRDYERARAAGADLAALPSLLIVVDEFSELLTARPEFLDLFVAIGRLGRSLGLHLLLASQRLDEGRLRGLESHLSFRIGLRTFSAQESRTVLGVPDAYELPPEPGLGFLRTDPSTMVRFTAAYVSGPAAGVPDAVHEECNVVPGILPWTTAEVLVPEPSRPQPTGRPEPHAAPSAGEESLLTAAVRRMEGGGPKAHQVWVPPLDVPDTLDALMPDLAPDPALGLVSKHWRALGGLAVPVGTVDRPREQRRDTLTVDLSGAGGHVAVVGGPRSGKSTLLRTLVTGLTLTTTPVESQFFVLDLGGGAFSALQRLAPPLRHRRAVRARRRTPDRRGGERDPRPPGGVLPCPRHRLGRDLPQQACTGPRRRRVRRGVPRRGRVEHAPVRLRRPRGGGATGRCARPHLRHPRARGVVTLVRLPRRGPRPVRHPSRAQARRPDGLRDRPDPGGRSATWSAGSRPDAGQAALPGSAAPDRRRPRRRLARRRCRPAGGTRRRRVARADRAEAAAAPGEADGRRAPAWGEPRRRWRGRGCSSV